MHLLCIALATLSQAGPLPFGHMGPELPPVKGLRRPLPIAASVADYAHSAIIEIGGGAVVVVEDYLPFAMPKVPEGFTLIGGRLRFQTGAAVGPTTQGVQPAFPWMDSNAVRSGGNVVGRVYPMGLGY